MTTADPGIRTWVAGLRVQCSTEWAKRVTSLAETSRSILDHTQLHMHCIIVVMIVKQMIRGKVLKHASCDMSEIIHKVVTQLFFS